MSAAVMSLDNKICTLGDDQLDGVNGGEMSTGVKIAVATAVGLGCGGAIILGVFAVAVAAGYLANR